MSPSLPGSYMGRQGKPDPQAEAPLRLGQAGDHFAETALGLQVADQGEDRTLHLQHFLHRGQVSKTEPSRVLGRHVGRQRVPGKQQEDTVERTVGMSVLPDPLTKIASRSV